MARTSTSHSNGISNSMEEDTSYAKERFLVAVEEEEVLLLRECLYALQGMNGERIKFGVHQPPMEHTSFQSACSTNRTDGIILPPLKVLSLNNIDVDCRSRLGSGATDALNICGEAGWLYRRIQSYVNQVQQQHVMGESFVPRGFVSRAFAATLSSEIRNYHSLLATIESRLQLEVEVEEESPSKLTLRQLMVDLHMPTRRLATLAMITDGTSPLSGGQLLSALYKHTLHGNTRHSTLVQSIVYASSQPWFDVLYLWTQKGILQDAHYEFFIAERPGVEDENMWKDRYFVKSDQIPFGILDNDLVRPSLIVGKGINFIRKCLCDTKWVLQLNNEATNNNEEDQDQGKTNQQTMREQTQAPDKGLAELKTILGYHYAPVALFRQTHPNESRYISPLHRTLGRAAQQVHSHILRSLQEQHHLIQHLWALKQFLFLGQGDFISALMDGLAAEFDGPHANGIIGIYTHTLTRVLEGALRSTNAAALPSYTLERLRVELELKEEDEESRYKFGPDRFESLRDDNDDCHDSTNQRNGWDVFALTYEVSAPLSAIVHPEALEKYRLVFSLLFRLKRVEYMLNATWRQSTALQHALQTTAQYNGIHLVENEGYSYATIFLRKISMTRQSMLHFVGNLQSYLMLEVLELGWKGLVRQIEAATTLDEVIDAHDCYLNDILRKCLLRGTKKTTSSGGGTDDRHENQLAIQIDNLLDTARIFCTKQECIFSDALKAVERAEQKRKEAERRMKEGQWGFDTESQVLEEETFFGLTDSTSLQEVVSFSEEFTEQTLELLKGLHEKIDGAESASPSMTPGRPHREEPRSQHFDDALRFLTFQLEYNDYYKRLRTEPARNGKQAR